MVKGTQSTKVFLRLAKSRDERPMSTMIGLRDISQNNTTDLLNKTRKFKIIL